MDIKKIVVRGIYSKHDSNYNIQKIIDEDKFDQFDEVVNPQDINKFMALKASISEKVMINNQILYLCSRLVGLIYQQIEQDIDNLSFLKE